ncbi:MAG TPA: hypothetical protein VFU07_10220 [Candidatus Lumbricidophila sp.]|nr:hypothetical protein [Candidatus Lumbricidophila sp.]
MQGKLLLVIGLAAGYVLGSRAGRGRYEQIKQAADKFWSQPQVQKGVDTAKDFAKDKLGDAGEAVLDAAKSVIANVTKSKKPEASAKPAADAS